MIDWTDRTQPIHERIAAWMIYDRLPNSRKWLSRSEYQGEIVRLLADARVVIEEFTKTEANRIQRSGVASCNASEIIKDAMHYATDPKTGKPWFPEVK